LSSKRGNLEYMSTYCFLLLIYIAILVNTHIKYMQSDSANEV